MAENDLVLRSFHIDPEVDAELRETAYWAEMSKAHLVRLMIDLGLAVLGEARESKEMEELDEETIREALQEATAEPGVQRRPAPA